MSGAWETKISHREKRQQRKRDKVQTDSLDSAIPGIENTITVNTEQLTTASFPVGSKKNKGILVEHKSDFSNPTPFNQMCKISLRQNLTILNSLCYWLIYPSLWEHCGPCIGLPDNSSVACYILPNEWPIELKLPFCLESHEKMMPLFSHVYCSAPTLLHLHFLQWTIHLLSGIICHHSACWVLSLQDEETSMFWVVQDFLLPQLFENAIGVW